VQECSEYDLSTVSHSFNDIYLNPLKPDGNYISQIYVQSVTVFDINVSCAILTVSVNSDYFLKQHKPVDLCNGEV
jgi:hypothetical protein